MLAAESGSGAPPLAQSAIRSLGHEARTLAELAFMPLVRLGLGTLRLAVHTPIKDFEPLAIYVVVVHDVHRPIQGTLRPAQQEAGAGLAQGKLGRQLRTGRALLALGRWGGAECLRRQQRLTRSSLARDVVTCLMIVLNSARGLCARDWARRALAPTPGASRSHAPKGALRRG